MLFLILADLITNILNKNIKIKSKDTLLYLLYIILTILGGLVVIKSPGNATRMLANAWWYDMPLIKRLCTSIPAVSLNAFKLFNPDNLVITIFLILLIIYGLKNKSKKCKVLNILILLCSVFCIIFNNGWIYFALSILVFIDMILISYLNNFEKFGILTIAFYSVVFSMIITPEYFAARPNYYIYIFWIINIVIFINEMFNKKTFINIIQIFSIMLFIFTCICEYKIYTYIGNIHNIRLEEIEKVKKENLKVLKYKKINEKYSKYHPDSNSPSDETYWAYNYFLSYYDLPKDLKIELAD